MKILVVDDNDGMRYAKVRILKHADYLVFEASNGGEALRLVEAEHPDLILLDVNLPDSSGFDLCQRLKRHPATGDIMIIQTSGSFVEEHDKVRGLEGGADAYLEEPIHPQELVATVKALLRLRKTDQELRQIRDVLEQRVQERTAELQEAVQELRREIHKGEQSERALRASQQFLKSTLDALSSHIAILDKHGSILDLNASWEAFAEAATPGFLAQSQGKGFGDFFRSLASNANKALIDHVISGIYEVIGQQRRTFFCEYEQLLAESLQCFYVRVTFLEEVAEGHTMVVLENMSEIKRAEEALRHQQEALYRSEKLAAMGALLANVAHELNNPLAVTQMQLDVLAEEISGRDLQEKVADVRESNQRCVRIVQSFLNLARQHTPQRVPVDVNSVVTNAIQFLSHTLQLDNVTVEQQLADPLPLIGADAEQLQQVVVNLLLNAQQALQSSSDARRQICVTSQFDQARNHIVLEIADTGPGVPAHIEERIFEPFITTKPVGVGTGLGLSVCRGIVESHGGTIRLVQRPGYGAVFQVDLPVVSTQTVTNDTPDEQPPAAIQGKILIVDDEVGLTSGFARLLRRDGHTVDTANNGKQALTILTQQEYDLILCDLRMPELDGPGLYRAIGERSPHLCSRFVFVTGDTLGQEAKAFLEQVGVPHLVKPFSAVEGRRLVRQALLSTT